MQICYVMHEFGGDPLNLVRASEWVAFLNQHFNAAFYAPWIPLCEHWKDEGDSLKRGLEIDRQFIIRSDSAIAVGGCISRGIWREIDLVVSLNKPWLDASGYPTTKKLLEDKSMMERLGRIFSL